MLNVIVGLTEVQLLWLLAFESVTELPNVVLLGLLQSVYN